MATVDAHAVVEGRLALLGLLVTRVGQPAVGLQKHGRAEVLLRVPPVRGATGAAAGAENALVEAVKLLAVGLGLQIFLALWGKLVEVQTMCGRKGKTSDL